MGSLAVILGSSAAVGSVGSLKADLGVGSLIRPDDFIALQVTVTSFDAALPELTHG